jgi:putative redox protein
MRFLATPESGSTITLDARPEQGGTGRGPAPMDTVLLALGTCTGMDVVSILRKMRAPLRGLEIRITADRAEEHPRVFTRIHIEYVLTGPELQTDHAARAVELSQEKYCPVAAMLRKAAEVTYSWRITGAAGRA